MGRFDRGMRKLEQAQLEEQYAAEDDPMAALREIVAEHRAQQTPLQRYLSDKIQVHVTELIVTGSTTVKPLTIDELLDMAALR
jgi:hypothetical protein